MIDLNFKISIVIPTYNGLPILKECIESLFLNVKEINDANIIVIDSSSTDGTAEYLKSLSNIKLVTIPSNQFNHGGTRNLGVELSKGADIVIFLTQDAILNNDKSILNLLKSFDDPKVAVSYGRQLPHVDANPIASHARFFNYSSSDYESDLNHQKGLKTVFNSNSFAAYRVSIFNELDGFPKNTILSEDMYLAAKAVLANYKIVYKANAEVRHSHNYTPIEEFKRYFDIGVFHHDEKWIRESFGQAEGEGKKFIFSELKYLGRNNKLWIPRAVTTNFLKILGYKLGLKYQKLPKKVVKKFSMHKKYWVNFK